MMDTTEDRNAATNNDRYQAPHLSEFYSIVNNESQKLPVVNESNVKKENDLVSDLNELNVKMNGEIHEDSSNVSTNNQIGGFGAFSRISSRFSSRRPSSVKSGMSSISDLRTLVTKRDMDNTANAINNLYKNSKIYSSTLTNVSHQSSELANSLEVISRLKGCSDLTADKLLKASGLFHLLANHEQIMSRIVHDLLNENILNELNNFTAKNKTIDSNFKSDFKMLSSNLKIQEKKNAELSKRKIRNILSYRESLNSLQCQLDQVETLKHDYFQDCYTLVEEACDNVLKNVASTTRAQVEISENIARKGWSGGGLDNLLSNANDPFNYESDDEGQYSVELSNTNMNKPDIRPVARESKTEDNLETRMNETHNNTKNTIINKNSNMPDVPNGDEIAIPPTPSSDKSKKNRNSSYTGKEASITSPLKNEIKGYKSDDEQNKDDEDYENHSDYNSDFDNSFSLPILPASRNNTLDRDKTSTPNANDFKISNETDPIDDTAGLLPGTQILRETNASTESEYHDNFDNQSNNLDDADIGDQSTIIEE